MPDSSPLPPKSKANSQQKAAALISRAQVLLAFAVGIASALASGAYMSLAPPRFEATASLTMAHVMGAPVEVPAVLVEKIKSGTFFSQAAWAACDMNEAPDPGRQLADKIHPISNRNAPFVGISFVARSTDQAAACIAQVIGEITAAQDQLVQPVVVSKRAQLQEMKRRLTLLQASDLAFEKIQGVSEVNHQQFHVQSLWLSAAMSRHEAERELARRIADLEIKLTAPLTHPTRLVSAIYTPPIPLGPPVWMVLLAGFMCGSIFAIGLILLRQLVKARANDQLAV